MEHYWTVHLCPNIAAEVFFNIFLHSSVFCSDFDLSNSVLLDFFNQVYTIYLYEYIRPTFR